MNASLKKFLGNKNTVTILGVLLCIVILIVGYNKTINSKIQLTNNIPYALQDIQPKTLITSDMIGTMSVPEAFVKVGEYYKSASDIVGKYSNYNTMIAKGSLFYKGLVTQEKYLPDSYMYNVPSGSTVINYPVNMSSTYANSMMPGDYINIYFKAILPASENEENKDSIMFGKFLSNIEILSVKDSQGQHVFENTEEVRTPAYMLFAVKEEQHLLLRKALYLQNDYSVELLLVPNTGELPDDVEVNINSNDITKFINDRTELVDVTDLPSIEDAINNQNKENEENTEE